MSQQNARPSEIEKSVFVVTYGRSGSTLLQNLLNSIDGYCIRGENENAVAPLAQSWHAMKRSANLRSLARRNEPTTPESPWYGAEKINVNQVGKALANAFIRTVLMPPAGTRVVGFKEIRWANDPATLPVVLNFLHASFPKAHFIFNTRNLDEVARSGWWATMDADTVKDRLTKVETQYATYLRNNPGRGVRVHYNDYIGDHAALAPMFDFIGETFDIDRVAAIMDKRLTHLQKAAPEC